MEVQKNRLFYVMGTSLGDTANTIIQYDIDPNQWHFVTLTWQEKSTQFYVDGKFIGKLQRLPVNSFDSNPTHFTIGVYDDLRVMFYKGFVDDLYIHSRELSPKEINWLYQKIWTKLQRQCTTVAEHETINSR